MLYHVSRTPDLTVLRPQVSSHGKAYVYAVDNLVTGLLFGARQDDFDFRIDSDGQERPVVYECYPHAFASVFQGKSCSVYELCGEGFQKGMTGWDPEYVCEREVPVLREYRIPDLYERLRAEQEQGNIVIQAFCDDMAYKRLISEHIVDRLIRFNALDCLETDVRFQNHYKRLILGLRSLMDGHLL